MNVQLQDVTNAFTALDIVGPASRALMSEVTGKTMSPNEFPSFSFRVFLNNYFYQNLFQGDAYWFSWSNSSNKCYTLW